MWQAEVYIRLQSCRHTLLTALPSVALRRRSSDASFEKHSPNLQSVDLCLSLRRSPTPGTLVRALTYFLVGFLSNAFASKRPSGTAGRNWHEIIIIDIQNCSPPRSSS